MRTSNSMRREAIPRLTTISFRAVWCSKRPSARPTASISTRFSKWYSPFQTRSRAWESWDEGTAVRKPRLPILMPSMGVREPAISRATRSMVPSPPKTRRRSTARARAAASGQTVDLKFARREVARSLKILRPAAWRSLAALVTALAQETLAEFPMIPTR